ncbi:hypothetical protein ACI01nite_08490 [Acetobacter cibinongensis]|uniref:DUF3035 domain-containing protein n=1 Tax=Acetobacter cibinongensis TaxID=146475 RepID=A0A0D6N2P5_9PROT|nr:DUF3035 domain-containing protein [Acetobacter cibinongensis]GAN60257.1 hypothetical protein Abci_010_122 [Acetobacter cibinongensis]GBQ18228.1 hypothetical protein AA0482_2171 [Acetobacter cibinongensis NRIC 0482]GEL58247.1 hypothetical protein ACI01nite_08490 [Acetobacter cibinongensis]
MARRVSTLISPLLLLGGCVLLTGCSGSEAARAFGLERSMPDEYTVTTRAPLSMPPMDELAKPVSGAERPQDESERLQALETLSPDVALHGENGSNSDGQSMLVTEASQAADAPDQGELGQAGSGFVEQLMFWKGGKAGAVVDADEENRRLKTNAALGKPPTHGVTPTQRAPK